MRASTELMLRKIYRRMKCNWFGGSKHRGYVKFQELAGSMSYATDDYTTYIGLRQFKSWMLSDLLVFHIVFLNCTLIQDMSHQEKVPRRGGTITFGDMATPYMAVEEGGFKFITCEGGERGMMSLIGNVSQGICCISGVWILVGVVLSDAYKGRNITDLSSPIPPIKPTKFTDLLDQIFTIYTYSDDEQLMKLTNGLSRS
ncbi:unnamed protein product [Orchesella dallaii]|uniref:Uncharacterized protein n=1 Tax=Orchesella dallaii TaxID=48710 RepID=A0ABP1RRW0_9HEXA